MSPHRIVPGIYEHYKGKKYFVLGLSRNTETNEVCVVYRPLYETDWPQLVHRNAEMFFEEVTVEGKRMPRFRLLDSGHGTLPGQAGEPESGGNVKK